jgi:hypothetical protein
VRRIVLRGSHLGVRAFAVAVLLLGLVAGLVAGNQKNKSDTLTAIEPAAVAATDVPEVTERRSETEGKVYGAQVRASASARAYAVAQAKAKAQAAAEAAREAAAKAKADAARAEAERKAAAERASRSSSRTQATVVAPPVPVDCESYSGNKQIGCSLLDSFGFESGQMSCLEPLWDRESGWNERAGNQSSGAYGIPQALPGNKMAKFGSGWETDPVIQIKWGLDYIKNRYVTPCGAWSAFQSQGWY